MEDNQKTKKWYQKWWVWIIGFFLIMFLWNKTGDFIDEAFTKEIPNVMSINYTDAEKVLKEQGFKVLSIEANAGSVLSNSNYDRSVKKGEVFKVNNELYPDYYLDTKDRKVTIYYATEDYVCESPKKEYSYTDAINEITEDSNSAYTDTEAWKQFLKDYEAWADSYVDFMKKYKDNPSDISLISEYGKLLAETAEWSEKAEEYEEALEEDDDLSPEVITEYFNTLARIMQKISNIDD